MHRMQSSIMEAGYIASEFIVLFVTPVIHAKYHRLSKEAKHDGGDLIANVWMISRMKANQ